MHTLQAINLVKIYNNRKVVNKVSINVNGGEVVGLLGPNGAGKTTSFYMCVGLIGPDSGNVYLNNEDITKDPMYLRAHKGLGYLPQEASIFRKLSVSENLMSILETIPFPSQKARKDRMYELLSEFGVSHLENNLASSLSGGERRRVEIARTLTKSPHFILLDEPFAGIDPLAIADIQEIIKTLCKKGIGVLITDHNVRETLGICDRAYILVDGQILDEGSPQQIATSKKAQRYYLGDNFSL